MLPFHGQVNRLAITGLTDEAGVVIKVGKDFEEDFDRELENCPFKSDGDRNNGDGNPRTLTLAGLSLWGPLDYRACPPGDRRCSSLFWRHRDRGR